MSSSTFVAPKSNEGSKEETPSTLFEDLSDSPVSSSGSSERSSNRSERGCSCSSSNSYIVNSCNHDSVGENIRGNKGSGSRSNSRSSGKNKNGNINCLGNINSNSRYLSDYSNKGDAGHIEGRLLASNRLIGGEKNEEDNTDVYIHTSELDRESTGETNKWHRLNDTQEDGIYDEGEDGEGGRKGSNSGRRYGEEEEAREAGDSESTQVREVDGKASIRDEMGCRRRGNELAVPFVDQGRSLPTIDSKGRRRRPVGSRDANMRRGGWRRREGNIRDGVEEIRGEKVTGKRDTQDATWVDEENGEHKNGGKTGEDWEGVGSEGGSREYIQSGGEEQQKESYIANKPIGFIADDMKVQSSRSGGVVRTHDNINNVMDNNMSGLNHNLGEYAEVKQHLIKHRLHEEKGDRNKKGRSAKCNTNINDDSFINESYDNDWEEDNDADDDNNNNNKNNNNETRHISGHGISAKQNSGHRCKHDVGDDNDGCGYDDREEGEILDLIFGINHKSADRRALGMGGGKGKGKGRIGGGSLRDIEGGGYKTYTKSNNSDKVSVTAKYNKGETTNFEKYNALERYDKGKMHTRGNKYRSSMNSDRGKNFSIDKNSMLNMKNRSTHRERYIVNGERDKRKLLAVEEMYINQLKEATGRSTTKEREQLILGGRKLGGKLEIKERQQFKFTDLFGLRIGNKQNNRASTVGRQALFGDIRTADRFNYSLDTYNNDSDNIQGDYLDILNDDDEDYEFDMLDYDDDEMFAFDAYKNEDGGRRRDDEWAYILDSDSEGIDDDGDLFNDDDDGSHITDEELEMKSIEYIAKTIMSSIGVSNWGEYFSRESELLLHCGRFEMSLHASLSSDLFLKAGGPDDGKLSLCELRIRNLATRFISFYQLNYRPRAIDLRKHLESLPKDFLESCLSKSLLDKVEGTIEVMDFLPALLDCLKGRKGDGFST